MSVTMVMLALLNPDDRKGPTALAGAMAGLGMAIGPLVGGLFADHGDWRWASYVQHPARRGDPGRGDMGDPDSAARPQGTLDLLGAGLVGAFGTERHSLVLDDA